MLNFIRVKYIILTMSYINKLYILPIDKWRIIVTILILVKNLLNNCLPHLVFFLFFFLNRGVK